MKSVLVLTGFGLAVLAMLACRSSTPPPAPAPVSMPEPPPIVEIVDKIDPGVAPHRVLSNGELLMLKDDLRMLPVASKSTEEFIGTGKSKEFRIYSRAAPRPVKREPPIAKQD